MNEYSITNYELPEQPGFWRRQFHSTISNNQIVFDIAVGIFLPAACFFFDPIVFRSNYRIPFIGVPLQQYGLFVYFLSAFAIITLALWLMLGTRTRALSGAAFGVLLVGSVLSFLIGFIILPLTFIGLFFIIGILGFVPFLTAFVYFRNAVRCLRQRDARDSRPLFIGTMLLGAILVTSIPAIAQWKIRQVALDSAEQLLHSDSPSIEGAVQRLKYLSWFVDTDVIVRAYEHERDPVRKERLSRAYKEITGDDIEDRLAILND